MLLGSAAMQMMRQLQAACQGSILCDWQCCCCCTALKSWNQQSHACLLVPQPRLELEPHPEVERRFILHACMPADDMVVLCAGHSSALHADFMRQLIQCCIPVLPLLPWPHKSVYATSCGVRRFSSSMYKQQLWHQISVPMLT
jgi:hypothetical protein